MKRNNPYKNPLRLFITGMLLGMTSLGLTGGEKDVSGKKTTPHEQSLPLVHASDLVGADVLDAHNVRLGNIADFVVTFGESGRVTHIVVADALLPLLDEHKRLIPAEVVERIGDTYRLTVPKQIVSLSADLGRNQVKWIHSPEAMTRLDKVYEVVADDSERPHYLYSHLKEMRVELQNGREIGYVHDLLLSLQDNWTPFVMLLPTDAILRESPQDLIGIPTTNVSLDNHDGPATVSVHLPFGKIQGAPSVDNETDLSRELTKRGTVIILRE